MKNITISDETFNAICEVLVAAVNSQGLVTEFLIMREGLDSPAFQGAMDKFNRLDTLEIEFRTAKSNQLQGHVG